MGTNLYTLFVLGNQFRIYHFGCTQVHCKSVSIEKQSATITAVGAQQRSMDLINGALNLQQGAVIHFRLV